MYVVGKGKLLEVTTFKTEKGGVIRNAIIGCPETFTKVKLMIADYIKDEEIPKIGEIVLVTTDIEMKGYTLTGRIVKMVPSELKTGKTS